MPELEIRHPSVRKEGATAGLKPAEKNAWIAGALIYVLMGAFALRFGFALTKFCIGMPALGLEPRNWWSSGYHNQYAGLAFNLAEGKGLIIDEPILGSYRALRPPLYPLLLALEYRFFGTNSLVPILVQSLIGTGTVFLAFLLGREVFGPREGLASAIMAMAYPYYVGHDTALQETGILTFLVALATFRLLRAFHSGSLRDYLLAGIAIGISLLCKQTVLVFLPLAVLWLYACSPGPKRMVLAKIGGLVLAAGIVVSPWIWRNTLLFGKPLFTIELGNVMWAGHNPFTLPGYPRETIDKGFQRTVELLSEAQKAQARAMGEWERDQWFLSQAIQFIKTHPRTTVHYAAVKVLAGFSPVLNPEPKRWAKGLAYTASYLPILLLGSAGMALSRNQWRTLCPVYLLFLSFTATSIIAFAHTSHRSFLDVYLMIFASAVLLRPSRCLEPISSGQ